MQQLCLGNHSAAACQRISRAAGHDEALSFVLLALLKPCELTDGVRECAAPQLHFQGLWIWPRFLRQQAIPSC
jgi:hypothetical protein